MLDAPYASARAVFRDVLDILRPRARETVSQYAARKRLLSNPAGAYSGPWNHELAPFLVEPMDCLTSLEHQAVAVVGPGRSGKTSIAENWLLKSVATDPGDMLWYMPTDDLRDAYVKAQINPMIELHPQLSGRLGSRPEDRSMKFKRFAGMRAEFLSATQANLISKTAPRIVADEIDAYLRSLGDVKAQFDVRITNFGRHGKILGMSHPDLAYGLDPEKWTEGILAWYRDSDRRMWYWPCPLCGAWSSPIPIAPRHMGLWYPANAPLDEVQAEARLICPTAGCHIEDSYRREMLRYGRYVGLGQEISEDGVVTGELQPHRIAGFWIVGTMSLFVDGGIGALARARAKAERDAENGGDDAIKTFHQVMAKQWGYPRLTLKAEGTVDANVLAERAESSLTRGVVPDGVRFITVAADIQAAHFEWLVRGWGVKGESWIIEHGKLPASVDTSPEDWDQLLDQVLSKSWPLADGSGRHMRPRGAIFDSQGVPGVTDQAYGSFIRWHRRRKLRSYGLINGREAWSLLPSKGAKAVNAQRLVVVYPDTQRKAGKIARGQVPLASFNPNLFKDGLVAQLKVAEPGPGYVHFPRGLRAKEAPHPFFEQLAAEHRRADGRWEKKSANARNEALDLMVLTHVAAHLHGLSRINWEQPFPWAAPWDNNTMVDAQAPASPDNPATATAPPTPPVSHGKPGAAPAGAPERRSLASRLA
ncbi:MAG TPA: terminase gpA endonuclease subunit [Nevskia sp.]|nr:terminase gpA endonuclease subunit [Nevskia sp.]